MRVSIVIGSYEYEQFVRAAIDSALAQTHDDVEIIVVDDGSNDDTDTVLRSYGSRITVIHHAENRGQAAGYNSGFAAVTGDLTWFVDADDAVLPDACSRVVSMFANDPELVKAHGPLRLVDVAGDDLGRTIPTDPRQLSAGDLRDHVRRYRSYVWPPSTGNVYRTSALSEVMPVPEAEYRGAADSFLCEQLPICGTVGRSIEPLGVYRIHGGNQFIGRAVELGWLQSKLRREILSHGRLVELAERLGLDPVPASPFEAADVAFAGYRLTSLRLDPSAHRDICGPDDTRWSLMRSGVSAARTAPHLTSKDRLVRTVWFVIAAAVPGFGIRHLVRAYVPDTSAIPVWRRWRQRIHSHPKQQRAVSPDVPLNIPQHDGAS